MITITGPKSVTLPSSLGGDDQVFSLLVVCATRGLKVKDQTDGTMRVEGISDLTLLNLQLVQLLFSKGCDVHGYPVWFGVDPAGLVPDGMPGQKDDSDDSVRTWQQWATAFGRTISQPMGGVRYLSPVVGGEYVTAKVWVPLEAGGLTVVNKIAFNALTPDAAA